MANTTTISGTSIMITGLDADWSLATDMPDFAKSGLRVESITFNPSTANDVFVVRERSATGAKAFDVSCAAATDQKVKYYYKKHMYPYIAIADATLGTAANAVVEIEFC